MQKYVVLLRGINVGGHNKIAMANLQAMLEAAGGKKVTTYIQSGNGSGRSKLAALNFKKKIGTHLGSSTY